MAVHAVNNTGAYAGAETKVNTAKPVATTAPAVEKEKIPTNNANTDTTGTNTSKAGKASEQMLKDAVSEANNKLKINNRHCEFTYERDINRVSVKLVDGDTGEVIREVPSEETLDMIRRLKEMTGILVDEQR